MTHHWKRKMIIQWFCFTIFYFIFLKKIRENSKFEASWLLWLNFKYFLLPWTANHGIQTCSSGKKVSAMIYQLNSYSPWKIQFALLWSPKHTLHSICIALHFQSISIFIHKSQLIMCYNENIHYYHYFLYIILVCINLALDWKFLRILFLSTKKKTKLF